jgi:hypothetical protein
MSELIERFRESSLFPFHIILLVINIVVFFYVSEYDLIYNILLSVFMVISQLIIISQVLDYLIQPFSDLNITIRKNEEGILNSINRLKPRFKPVPELLEEVNDNEDEEWSLQDEYIEILDSMESQVDYLEKDLLKNNETIFEYLITREESIINRTILCVFGVDLLSIIVFKEPILINLIWFIIQLLMRNSESM